jgi:UDP-N-acetylmuramoyl-tripeptide--D-alanyl-D-alanine ligase
MPRNAPFVLRSFLRKATDPLNEIRRRARSRAALLWRNRLGKTIFVGITGSHGKTTATVLLGQMLQTNGPTYAHKDHYFLNAKSAAQTVLRTRPWYHRYCVREISGHKPGAIEESTRYLQPSVGVVTAIGGDHRRAFRSFEATAAEKAKLVHGLPASGLAVLNNDEPLVAAMGPGCSSKVVSFGRAEDATLRLLGASSMWPARLTLEVAYRGDQFTVESQLVGVHWATSILAALLTALELGVSRQACLTVINSFEPVFNRMSAHPGPNGAWYVLDADKASFSGVDACLGFLETASASRKTVIVGTIADYPGTSRAHYYKVARMALARADRVYFTGPNAARVRRLQAGEFAGRLFVIEEPKDILTLVSDDALAGEIIYVKATRADRLASVFDFCRQ